MAMLRVCGHPGCTTLTLGALCLEHEQAPVQRAGLRPARAVVALAVPRAERRAKEGGAQRPAV
jgi:hypothetical protein